MLELPRTTLHLDPLAPLHFAEYVELFSTTTDWAGGES